MEKNLANPAGLGKFSRLAVHEMLKPTHDENLQRLTAILPLQTPASFATSRACSRPRQEATS